VGLIEIQHWQKKRGALAAKKGNAHGHRHLAEFAFERGRTAAEYRYRRAKIAIEHSAYAARGGHALCVENLQTLRENGLVPKEDLDEVEAEFQEARSLEWSEEREVFRRNRHECTY